MAPAMRSYTDSLNPLCKLTKRHLQKIQNPEQDIKRLWAPYAYFAALQNNVKEM